MEKKIKHLEMIQAVISRMANNSFVLKGWCVTLVAALFALSSANNALRFIGLSYLPVITFWALDGYYLWQERLYRRLYEKVRKLGDAEVDFSMNTRGLESDEASWVRAIAAPVQVIFYGTIIVAVIVTAAALRS